MGPDSLHILIVAAISAGQLLATEECLWSCCRRGVIIWTEDCRLATAVGDASSEARYEYRGLRGFVNLGDEVGVGYQSAERVLMELAMEVVTTERACLQAKRRKRGLVERWKCGNVRREKPNFTGEGARNFQVSNVTWDILRLVKSHCLGGPRPSFQACSYEHTMLLYHLPSRKRPHRCSRPRCCLREAYSHYHQRLTWFALVWVPCNPSVEQGAAYCGGGQRKDLEGPSTCNT